MSLPDFEDPEWNRRREELTAAVLIGVDSLVTHMTTPQHGCGATLNHFMDDGRHVVVTIQVEKRGTTQ